MNFPPNLYIIQRLNSSSLYLVEKFCWTLCKPSYNFMYSCSFPTILKCLPFLIFFEETSVYISMYRGNLYKRCLIQEVVGVLYNKCIFYIYEK